MEITFSLDAISKAAKDILQQTKDKKVYAFHGEMGAGKTTLIHAVCDAMGVKDVVGSPTFSIINEYRFGGAGTPGKIYHIDLYRVKDEEEAMRAGVEDCLYSGETCLVEWPEKAPRIFPGETVHVYITVTGTKTRKLRIGRN